MAQETAAGGENGRSADTLSTEPQRMTATNSADKTATTEDEQSATTDADLATSCAGCAKDIRHFNAEAREFGWCPECAPECYPLGGDQ